MPAELAPVSATILFGDFGHAIVQTSRCGTVAQACAPYTLIFHIDGADALFTCAGEPVRLDSGSCVLVNPWTLYARQDTGPGRPTVLLSLHVHAEWLRLRFPNPHAGERLFHQPQTPLTVDLRASRDRLRQMVANPVGVCSDAAERAVLSLVADAACAGAHRPATVAEPQADTRIQQAMRHVQEHIASPLAMGDIASAVGLSRTGFFEYFKHCLGIAPQQYIDGMRTALATRMLAGSDLPIAQVSDALGFSAATHFARFFVRRVGLTPVQFRRSTTMLAPQGGHGGRLPAPQNACRTPTT